jgi:hypothetical protein
MDEQAPAIRKEVFSIPEGEFVLTWPTSISAASFEEVDAWLNLLKHKISRCIDADRPPSGRVRSGKARMATMSPEARKELGKKASAERWRRHRAAAATTSA